jgi:flagellar hook-associated protein 1 FlgK
LQVDGNSGPAIKLNPADASLSDVASDLNSQFSSLGIRAKATLDPNTGALVLASTNTGSNGSIQILSGSANATLGLTNTTPTYGNAANSVALGLSALAKPTSTADEINGQSFTAYFGSIAAAVGSRLADATNGQSVQQSVVTQAQSLRQQLSGVDLNTEATRVLQLQASYQAASKMITVIDTLTQSALAIIPQSA